MGFAALAKSIGTMRLRTKLALLMAILGAGFLVIALTFFQTLTRVDSSSASLRAVTHMQEALHAATLQKAELLQFRAELVSRTTGINTRKAELGSAALTALLPNEPAYLTALPLTAASEQTRTAIATMRSNWLDLATTLRTVIIPALAGDESGRTRDLVSNYLATEYRRTAASLDTVLDILQTETANTKLSEATYARKTIAMGFAISVGIVLLLLLIVWTAGNALAKPVQMESSFAAAVVDEKNLSDRLDLDRGDEIGDLASGLDRMVDLLHDMVVKVDDSSRELSRISRTIADASRQVFSGADHTNDRVGETLSAIVQINASIKEVSQGVDGLSLSASENSSSVLEMAASVEEVALNVENLAQSVDDVSSSIIEMAAAIKHISDSVNGLIDSSTITASSVIQMDSSIRQVERSALDTAAISEEVRLDAETGKASVEATISGMQEIKRSSHITHEVIVSLSEKARNIGTILSVINEVAEQTNLLALNAAIIAAQAGEQGKGFAVVADEIKELSDRTSSSTREIEELIKGVQEETRRAVNAINLAEKNIDAGELLSQESGLALSKIVAGVEKASEQVGEIARAAAEQARGSQMIREAMEQVTDMIMQIANATQQQSKGSELIMTAVERMKVLTSQVRSSTREQSKVGTLIAGSTESITSMISQIKRACDEQSRGSEQIVVAVEDIQRSTHEDLHAAGTMEKAVTGLSRQIDVLKKEISGFSLKETR
jgi:methyl-accepting chemotaxis protein